MRTILNRSTYLFHSLQKFFSLVLDAVRGKEHDYTRGSLRHAVILLAIPMVLEMGMESVFAVVDIFFVSSLGAEAVAIVGLTEAVLTLIYAVAMGFGMGITAVIARRVGEGNIDKANLTAGQVALLSLLISSFLALIGFTSAEEILRLMGGTETVIAEGKTYTMLMLGGSITIVYLFTIAAVFRGAGNAIIAMRALWIANGINIVLDPCFIFGWGPFPELGVTGAAVATNIGRGVGALYLIYNLAGGTNKIHVALKHFRFATDIAIGLVKVSFGGIMQFFIATASWVFLMRIVAQFGSEDVAGYTIAIRIALFTFLPAWGLSNAAATLVGQNLGANQVDRAETSVWLTAKYNIIFMLCVGIVLVTFANPLVAIFSNEPGVLSVGTLSLRIIALGYPCYALGMVLVQAFNGAGDTITPTKINFACFWLFQIPFAWVAANLLGWGTMGVALAVMLAEVFIAGIGLYIFRTGKWKLSQV